MLSCASGAAAEKAAKDPRLELGAKALKILTAATKHDDSDVRALAAEQWGPIGNPAAVPLLKEALEDVNPYVRIAAARSLSALGDPTGVKWVEKIVATAPRPSEADDALSAIEEMRALARNKVRVVGIRALAAMGSETSMKVLTQARDDADGSVRDASSLALVRLGAGDLKSFRDALSSEDPEVRAKAARSLAEVATPSMVSEVEPLAGDTEFTVRAAAMEALGASRSSEALEGLEKGLADQNELVRAKAAEGLAKIPGPGSVALLRQALKSTSGRIELFAMIGLARQGEPADSALAERALALADIDARMLAIEVLEAVGGERALSALEQALDDHDPKVRVLAAAALLKLLKNPAKEPIKAGGKAAR